jgi:hypothetical protein
MDIRIYLIGIAFIVILSAGTGVLAQSNTTGNNSNNTDVGSAAELAELTSNNSFANLTDMTTFNDTGANLTSNQSQTTNQTSNMSG